MEAGPSPATSRLPHRHVVLFYRYFLADDQSTKSHDVVDSDGADLHGGALDKSTLQFFQAHSQHYLPLLQKYQIDLCEKLGNMKGRILISTEGINGTLSCHNTNELDQYKQNMHNFDLLSEFDLPEKNSDSVDVPKPGSGRLFANIDWKTSTVDNNHMTKDYQEPFPDLKVQIVKEIVNTGGTIDAADIPIYTGKEISPEDFHLILTQARANGGWVAESEAGTATVTTTKKKVVLIDVRNTFEHAIGHFVHPHSNNIVPIEGDNTPANVLGEKNESSKNNTSTSEPTPAINPNTVTFSHFDSNFCSKYTDVLKDKKVLMYCTGGIRCVKASAMLKKRGIEDVSHLSGGIHRYLEKYSSEGFYKGKCMVFDQRVALDPKSLHNQSASGASENANSSASEPANVVGKCIECQAPYDQLSGANLCTVCRDLVLICPTCHDSKYEYHCDRHRSWKDVYFTFLDGFTVDELQTQKVELKKLHDSYVPAKEHKNVRNTLRKQMEKVTDRINELKDGSAAVEINVVRRCRTCFETGDVCDGLCWGFWKHKQSPYQQHQNDKLEPIARVKVGNRVTPGPHWNEMRLGGKYASSCAPESKKANTCSHARSQSQAQSTGRPLKTGTVVQIKSWGSGGSEQDCVAVLWDEKSPSSRRRRNGRGGNKEANADEAQMTQQAEIYRWGAVTRNGRRMYDVKLVS